ncbi:MAG: SDR family NAD(P)-dependent oxidoreductase [Burkholderiaceae bacterium]|nr:SDR family NAD(P)-dependent oxidoreductase [Burkholderiaceae bacterium]
MRRAGSVFGPLNPPLESFRDRRVWVIGASSGIGEALAAELAARGARLAVSARRLERLAEVAGPSALLAPLDVTDVASVRAAAARIRTAWGGVDLALLVAGTHVPMRADSWDLAQARAVVEVNLLGTLHCLDAVLPMLREAGAGGIGIVASVAGYLGLPRALIYGPTKAALINLAESLYFDLAPRGIGVYLINPGFVDTPLTRKNDFRMPALMQPQQAARATLDGIAAGRFEIHYPRRFTFWLKLARMLPYRLQFAALRAAIRA